MSGSGHEISTTRTAQHTALYNDLNTTIVLICGTENTFPFMNILHVANRVKKKWRENVVFIYLKYKLNFMIVYDGFYVCFTYAYIRIEVIHDSLFDPSFIKFAHWQQYNLACLYCWQLLAMGKFYNGT